MDHVTFCITDFAHLATLFSFLVYSHDLAAKTITETLMLPFYTRLTQLVTHEFHSDQSKVKWECQFKKSHSLAYI